MIKLKISYEDKQELQDVVKHFGFLTKYEILEYKEAKNDEGKYKKAYVKMLNKKAKL